MLWFYTTITLGQGAMSRGKSATVIFTMGIPSLLLSASVLALSLSLHICTRKLERGALGLIPNQKKNQRTESGAFPLRHSLLASFLSKNTFVNTKDTFKLLENKVMQSNSRFDNESFRAEETNTSKPFPYEVALAIVSIFPF
jgi:hypothetical protein